MTEAGKIFEATKNDLEVCERYRKLFGSDAITEEVQKKINLLQIMNRATKFANTVDDFWKNVADETIESKLDECDIRRIKFYVNSQLKKEDE